MAVKGVEATLVVLLGTLVQHALKRTNRVQAIGLSDGPSRHVGTHQGSSLVAHASMKQGSFPPGGLCCPAHHRYYDPLRLPLDYLALPGSSPVIDRHAPLPAAAGRVGPLQFPRQLSDRSAPPAPGGS